MKEKKNVTLEDVTVVTRNDTTAILSMLLYVAVFYYLAHPDKAEKLKDKLNQYKNSVLHKISIWQTKASIQSLPEVDIDN